jgi:inner membrane protein
MIGLLKRGARVLALVAVLLAISMALSTIEGLGWQRQAQRNAATQSIAAGVAGAPTLIGPWITRQCEETYIETTVTQLIDKSKWKDAERKTTLTRTYVLTALPETSQFTGDVKIEQRYRSIYKANVLGAQIVVNANWASLRDVTPPEVKAPVTKIVCADPVLQLYVSDQRSLRDAKMMIDGTQLEARSGTPHAQLPTGLNVVIPNDWVARTTPLQSKLTLQLVGTEALDIVPLAKSNAITLQSNWPHPSFTGAFLPDYKSITKDGFTAGWSISSLSSSARAWFNDGAKKCADTADGERACAQSLRVQFIDPINPAVLAERATKYGFLFVLLTFVGVGLLQVLRKLDIHPIQYLMTGAALAVFFLLLISLSEHIEFLRAYLIAAGSCAVLLGVYASGMLNSRPLAVGFGAAIAMLYAVLYLVLRSEQHALLAGSLTVFAVLATVMLLTRKLDWSAVFARFAPARAEPMTDAAAPTEPQQG